VKKFEKVLNEFEFKSLVLVVFEKQKKKNLTSSLFWPSRPAADLFFSRSSPPPLSSFSFPRGR
jgi:hypothetical protein